MAKISFEIPDELFEALTEKLDELQLDQDQWFRDETRFFLESLTASNDEAHPNVSPVSVSFGNIIPQDCRIPPEEIEKILIDSIKEGFSKLGFTVSCSYSDGTEPHKVH